MSDPVSRKGATEAGKVTPEAAPSGAGAAFRGAVHQAGVDQASAVGTGAAGRAEALRALASEVRAGRLDPAAAVEQLVRRILAEGPASSLPPEQRARLEEVLRSQLAHDPALLALQKNLG